MCLLGMGWRQHRVQEPSGSAHYLPMASTELQTPKRWIPVLPAIVARLPSLNPVCQAEEPQVAAVYHTLEWGSSSMPAPQSCLDTGRGTRLGVQWGKNWKAGMTAPTSSYWVKLAPTLALTTRVHCPLLA